jgi:6-phosphogluconolactonase
MKASKPFVYVGGAPATIQTFLLDRNTGALEPRGKIDGGRNPSFLVADARHRFVYAVNEDSDQVAAFSIDPQTGLLTFVNRVGSEGLGPAYVSLDSTGQWALVANYGGGTVAVLPVRSDGSLGAAVDVKAPGIHSHLIRTDPSNRFAFVPNLGSDIVSQFRFDAKTGKLEPNSPPKVDTAPGAGPRHIEFHPKAPYVYLINETGDSVVVYTLDQASGTLSPRQTVTTLPVGFDPGENYCADVHASADGRFLYGSNRGHDSIVVYSIDARNGQLALIGHTSTDGHWPRNFGLDPAGGILLVANQRSGTVVTFRIDPSTGTLTELVKTEVGDGPAWVGVIEQPDAD